MRIIRHGIMKCKKCDSVFEINKDDVKEKEIEYTDDIGIIIPYYKKVKKIIRYVECPCCGYEIELL